MPTAAKRRQRRIPLIWLVPLVTALIGGWLAWDTFSKRGPTITIEFASASGLTAGQSQLKFKDVSLGTVKAIDIAPDLSKVIVTVETTHEAKPLLTDKTIFWVVKPQLFAGRISGLDTLLAGFLHRHDAVDREGQSAATISSAKPDPPILESSVPGTVFKLSTKRIRSISLGSPIFYRDIEVGTVLGWDLADMARHVTIHAFVRAPFDQYVHEDSLWWDASGVSVKLESNGVKVQLELIKALLLGGIAFETDPDRKSKTATPDQFFPLYANRDAANNAGYGRKLQMVSYFEGSVAGLQVGADVTLHGLKIGEVTDLGLVFNAAKQRIMVPVHYTVEGDRVAGIDVQQKDISAGTVAEEMVRRGFRATLDTSSLLTGTKVIALRYVADAPPGGNGSRRRHLHRALERNRRARHHHPLRGRAPGQDQQHRLRRHRQEPVRIGQGPRRDRQWPAAQEDTGLRSRRPWPTRKTSCAGWIAMRAPAIARLPEISKALDDSLVQINRLAASLNTGYGDNSRFSREIDRLLPQLNETARSFRALADLLSRHPEALIQGRTNKGKE